MKSKTNVIFELDNDKLTVKVGNDVHDCPDGIIEALKVLVQHERITELNKSNLKYQSRVFDLKQEEIRLNAKLDAYQEINSSLLEVFSKLHRGY